MDGVRGLDSWAVSLGANSDIAFAQWIWGVNRGVLLPPGLDEQWLMSVVHTERDLSLALDVFTSFLDALMDPSRIANRTD